MKQARGIRVKAPLTWGNFAAGKGSLALCIDGLFSEIWIKETDHETLAFDTISNGKDTITQEWKNWITETLTRFVDTYCIDKKGFQLKGKIPFSQKEDLGSWEALSVAALFAVNEMLRRPIQKRELVPFLVNDKLPNFLEPHRLVSSLWGSGTLLTNKEKAKAVRIFIPIGFQIIVGIPETCIQSEKQNTSNPVDLANLILSLERSDFPNIKEALSNYCESWDNIETSSNCFLFESQENGVVMGLFSNSSSAEDACLELKKRHHSYTWTSHKINREGAELC